MRGNIKSTGGTMPRLRDAWKKICKFHGGRSSRPKTAADSKGAGHGGSEKKKPAEAG